MKSLNARSACIIRWSCYAGAVLVGLILVGAVTIYVALRGSLPHLEGELALAGLGAPASIERDAFGVPAIRAGSRVDLAFATGFAHAQDRFFQMDLMRRSAAGKLAALLGPALVEADRKLRVHRFSAVAREVVARAKPHQRELLDAYAAGVNAGLDSLRVRPWEYLVLRLEPTSWEAKDSVLAAFSMYLSLHESTGASELAREHLRGSMPPELFAFMHPVGTEWDAPIEGGPWRTPPIPSAEVINLREASATAKAPARASSYSLEAHRPYSMRDAMPGSNAWAVAALYTKEGGALLANDMHLGLRLPNVWYHARLIVERSKEGLDRDMVGVTLPGLPFLIAGSNGRVAWGYTNSYGDWTDLVIVEVDEHDSTRYLTLEGAEPFELHRERIEVNGGPTEEFVVRTTRWGPVVREESNGRVLALAWTAHRPEATNLEMAEFETSASVEALFDHANRAGAPVQNILAVDASSNIGWSLMGQLPVRGDHDASVPSSWRSSNSGWLGWRSPNEYPRVVNPAGGRLWSANNRMIDAQRWFELLGEGRYDLGARAGQIRDGLRSLPEATSHDLAALQADDRALFLTRWRDLLLEQLERPPLQEDARYGEVRERVRTWSGRASAEDVGYRLVRAFRNQVRADVYDMLTAAARANAPVELVPSPQFEGPLWALVTERPLHLLSPKYTNWQELLASSLETALAQLASDCDALSRCTWGRENTLSMRHPLSSAIPFIGGWVDMPAVPMNGDAAMPRVQGPSFGASERLVVSPGREAEGVIQMPGGPVGHPLSPFYGAGHGEWVRGEPRPLLPGTSEHVLVLKAP